MVLMNLLFLVLLNSSLKNETFRAIWWIQSIFRNDQQLAVYIANLSPYRTVEHRWGCLQASPVLFHCTIVSEASRACNSAMFTHGTPEGSLRDDRKWLPEGISTQIFGKIQFLLFFAFPHGSGVWRNFSKSIESLKVEKLNARSCRGYKKTTLPTITIIIPKFMFFSKLELSNRLTRLCKN